MSLQRYLDRIERRARVQVQAVPDLDGFRERLNAKLARVRARVRVNVDPDLSEFRSRLRERLQGANAGLGVRLDVSEREIARLRRELARIRPPMTIPARVEADRDRLATLARDASHLGDSSGGAGRKVLSLVGTLGKLSTAASSIPAVAGLSSSIASMAPAAGVAAPAVLALASAGVALKVGMSGVSDALSGDAEAMAELAPAAQDFVTQTKALAPAWDEVKRSVQDSLFEGLGDTLTRTANSVLPVLRTELSGTASALNAMGPPAAAKARPGAPAVVAARWLRRRRRAAAPRPPRRHRAAGDHSPTRLAPIPTSPVQVKRAALGRARPMAGNRSTILQVRKDRS
ncbi:hypothetical protein ABTY53_01255 [Streptomyces noursei]|uniref:hypothetical protein n=1 Tax=Streptomyces noursei TaxID=1971 RepID=UPI0033290F4F